MTPETIRLWANPFAAYKYEDIEPILLTPEMLEKVGFVKAEKNDQFGGYLIELWPEYRIRFLYDKVWTWDYYGRKVIVN